jgi:hypothetical protein
VGPFARFKPLVERALRRFPRDNKGQCAIRDDLPSLTTDPWLLGFSPAVCARGFANTGIYPLSKTVMLQGIVGKVPVSKDEPAHSASCALVTAVLGSDRNVRKLKRAGVDPDTACAVLCNVQLYSELQTLTKRSRRGGAFLDEDMASKMKRGGVCLSGAQMEDIMKTQEEQRRTKAETKAQAQRLREEARVARNEAKEKAVEERRLKKVQTLERKMAAAKGPVVQRRKGRVVVAGRDAQATVASPIVEYTV